MVKHYVYFPETFQSDDLPWDAAPYVVQLLRYYPTLEGADRSYRPTIRLARWFYRLSLIVPSSPISSRTAMSVMLALSDEAKEGANGWVNRVVELWLIHEPWDKPEDMQWYGKDSGPREKTPGLMRTEAFEAAVQAIDVDDDYIHSINASDAELLEIGVTREQYSEWIKLFSVGQ